MLCYRNYGRQLLQVRPIVGKVFQLVAYIIQLLLTVGASMFPRHTPLPKHGRIHVFSTEGDPKAHKVAMCFQGHLYP